MRREGSYSDAYAFKNHINDVHIQCLTLKVINSYFQLLASLFISALHIFGQIEKNVFYKSMNSDLGSLANSKIPYKAPVSSQGSFTNAQKYLAGRKFSGLAEMLRVLSSSSR